MTDFEVGSLIADSITAIAAVAAAVAACRGVRTWRQQLIGQNDYELAKRVLRQVYQLENVCRRVGTSLSNEDQAALWNRLEELFTARGVERLEAKVCWDDELVEPAQLLDSFIYDLRRAKRNNDQANNPKSAMPEQNRVEWRAKYGPMLEFNDDPDSADSKRLAAAVAAYEARLRPHLKR